jgi:hypothetical protein
MSEENVELVRQTEEALLRRDRDAWFAIHDEDFEIVPVRDWPEGGVRGREAGWDFQMRTRDSFEWVSIEVEHVDAGPTKSWAIRGPTCAEWGAAPRSSTNNGSSPRSVRGGSFACSGSRTVSTPSKPPGCRSR